MDQRWVRGLGLAVVASWGVSACATTPAPTPVGSSGATAGAKSVSEAVSALVAFAPRPQPGDSTTIDYRGLDAVFDRIVLRTGPSLRRWAARPKRLAGRRLVYGHFSPLRREGNKVVFSQLNEEAKATITALAENLIKIANRIDITRLSRDEQLAYWFNLHNVLVIAEVARAYPTVQPRSLRVGPDGSPLHDAPLATIRGVSLSLRDIRTGIVFRYWQDDPRVMYGFFHGDLASPNIRGRAWRATGVWKNLDRNAHEFVNALRGVRRDGSTMLVSPLYDEARTAGLFPDWPEGFRRHLRTYADASVTRILDETDGEGYARYEGRTADLVGGCPQLPFSEISGIDTAAAPSGWPGDAEGPAAMPAGRPGFGFSLPELRRTLEARRGRSVREPQGRGDRRIITDVLPVRAVPVTDDRADADDGTGGSPR